MVKSQINESDRQQEDGGESVENKNSQAAANKLPAQQQNVEPTCVSFVNIGGRRRNFSSQRLVETNSEDLAEETR